MAERLNIKTIYINSMISKKSFIDIIQFSLVVIFSLLVVKDSDKYFTLIVILFITAFALSYFRDELYRILPSL